jgi:hypothetical protein
LVLLGEVCKRRLWNRAALSIVALLGDLGETSRDSKIGLWKRRVSVYGNMQGGLLYWGPEGYVKKDSGNGRLYS